jgi:hypothetical protein
MFKRMKKLNPRPWLLGVVKLEKCTFINSVCKYIKKDNRV